MTNHICLLVTFHASHTNFAHMTRRSQILRYSSVSVVGGLKTAYQACESARGARFIFLIYYVFTPGNHKTNFVYFMVDDFSR